MSTLEYLDPDGSIKLSFVRWTTLNEWLSKLNGNTHVIDKPQGGVNRGKVIEELERRRTTCGSIFDKVALARGFGKDWRVYENERGYTHLEELLIYQPPEWRKQAREYVYCFDWDLNRSSSERKRQVIQKIDLGEGHHVCVTIPLSSAVLVTLLHPDMARSSRYEPLNFLLAYDAKDPFDDLKKIFEQLDLDSIAWQSFLRVLSPLDYFFEFRRHAQLYDLDKLRALGKKAQFPRLYLMNELDLSKIIGQRMAKQMIRQEVVRYFWNRGMEDICRLEQPLSMIFAGPTGIGKTELAFWLKELLNKPGEDAFRKVDCGLLTDASELVGRSGAYQGSSEASGLNEFVVHMAEKPESVGVVLLDKIEKAQKGVIRVLHQIFDTGKWTNQKLVSGGGSQTETVPCQNIIFIMTTNAADELICKAASKSDEYYKDPFSSGSTVQSELESRVRKKLQATAPFTNAFIGRIGRIVPFLPMSNGDPNNLLLGELLTVTKMSIEREQEELLVNRDVNLTPTISTTAKESMTKIIVKETGVGVDIHGVTNMVKAKMGNPLLHSFLLKEGGIKKGSHVEFSADEENGAIDFCLIEDGQQSIGDEDEAWVYEEDFFG